MAEIFSYSLAGLSLLSILTGLVGINLCLRLCSDRLKPALLSVQIVAILLGLVQVIDSFTAGIIASGYGLLLFLFFNSLFLLLVQMIALMACVPKRHKIVRNKKHIRVFNRTHLRDQSVS